MKPFYVTTPIYYVNGLPHIGHTYTTIVCDAIARYRRLEGRPVRFLTGTDEHGQKIERAAAEEGIEPQALADRIAASFAGLWTRLGISNDDFIRTTEARHETGVREIIRRIEAAGDLYVGKHEGWYCVACETFYTEKELGPEHTCPDHGTPTEWRSEENVFFRLSKYQDRLLAWYRDHPEAVRPETRRNEVVSFVEGGLRDLSVSRADLAWGIPFPERQGQTIYVWLDALTNYISALGFGREDDALYRRFWDAPEATRLHLVGKDILRFHAVYWPAFLMSAGLPLPTTVWVHGWWLRDARKVSKSGGNIVRLDHLVERFGADPVRYFLLREMAFGQDAQYSDEAFVERFNGELANGLGNTLSRVATLSRKAFDGKTPPVACDENPLVASAASAVEEYRRSMETLAFHGALAALWRLLADANQYLVEREPWKMVREEGASEELSRVLWNGLEAVRIVGTALLPVMPELAAEVLRGVGIAEIPESLDALAWGGTPTDAPLPDPPGLFPRIDKDAYLADIAPGDAPADTHDEDDGMITIDRFFETQLKVGTILTAEPVPKTDKLLKLTVDVGEPEPRTLVAGIAAAYTPEEVIGRQVAVVANLQPATIRGVQSQGMVLAASVDGKPVLLHPGTEVPPGTTVR
ncbi:MAG: methionine--tRNA ligase [Thermoanaerobaculia bacterium]